MLWGNRFSLSLCFEPLFWDICNVKQFWQWTQRMNYFGSPIWFALISTRGITLDKLLSPRSSNFLHYMYLEVSGFSYRIFFIFESSQLSEFSTDLQDSGLQDYFIILGTRLSSHEPVNVVVICQYLIKRRKIFLRHPVRTFKREAQHHIKSYSHWEQR